MGQQVVEVVPCRDPNPKHRFDRTSIGNIFTFWESSQVDDYFMAGQRGWVGRPDGVVFEVLGEHYHRRDRSTVCLRDIMTGEQFDVVLDISETLPWQSLNEMEVLAWASR